MNKRVTLLATASIAALLGSGTARAEFPVIDSANLANTANMALDTANMVKSLSDQLKAAQATLASIAHAPSNPLQASSSQFNVPALRNVLPAGSGAFGGLVNGTSLGGSGNLATQNLNANHVYAPQGNDFNAQQMAMNANSIAGVQASSQQLYQSATSHMIYMQDLESQLNDSPDAKTTADLQARIAAEQTYLQAQQVQASTLQTLQQAQMRNADQQRDERQRQNVDDVLAQDGYSGTTSSPGTGGGSVDQAMNPADQATRQSARALFLQSLNNSGTSQTTGQGSVAANMNPADQAYMDAATAKMLGGPISSSAPVSSVITPSDQAYMDAATEKMLGGPINRINPAP